MNILAKINRVNYITANDPFDDLAVRVSIFFKNVATGSASKFNNLSFLDFIDSIDNFGSGDKYVPPRATAIINFIKTRLDAQKNKLFPNLDDALLDKGVITLFINQKLLSENRIQNQSTANYRKIQGLYYLVNHFFDFYEDYALVPDPNFLNDRDEYEKAFKDYLSSNISTIPNNKRVSYILSEIEVITPTKLINDIRTNKMATSIQQSQAPSVSSVQSFQALTAQQADTEVSKIIEDVNESLTVTATGLARPKFNIEDDVTRYNNYVLSQLSQKRPIDTDLINTMRRKYPFIFSETYERNVLGYNAIINSGIVRSNINVNYKDLVLPIPSYIDFVKQDKQVPIATEQNVQNVLDRGYQIIASKGKGIKDEFLSFKQKGDNQFTGKYIHPKLKSSFSVTYNPRYNEYKIMNRNYPTGFVKKPFDIYAYINSLVKKQEMKKQSSNPPYLPRVVVDV